MVSSVPIGALWLSKLLSISQRLACELVGACQEISSGKAPVGIEFIYKEAKPVDGIIAHLPCECGGNTHEKGVVNATAGIEGENVRRAVDFPTDFEFASVDRSNQCIYYDVKEPRVSPTSSSIMSPHVCASKSWVFEVSKDGKERSWEVVDLHQSSIDLIDSSNKQLHSG